MTYYTSKDSEVVLSNWFNGKCDSDGTWSICEVLPLEMKSEVTGKTVNGDGRLWECRLMDDIEVNSPCISWSNCLLSIILAETVKWAGQRPLSLVVVVATPTIIVVAGVGRGGWCREWWAVEDLVGVLTHRCCWRARGSRFCQCTWLQITPRS